MSDNTLRLAVPKGRLMKLTLEYFATAGLIPPGGIDPGRKLVLDLPGTVDTLGVPVQLLLLKNADVPTYVEHGVAHLGVVGTDVLDETDAELLRPFTFPFGSCRIAVAGRNDQDMDALSGKVSIRVATKYVRTARKFFASRGSNATLVKLNGSVELGAVLGLADVVVDLVETGTTLRENDLKVYEVIGHTRVKLIANPGLSLARHSALASLVSALEAVRDTEA